MCEIQRNETELTFHHLVPVIFLQVLWCGGDEFSRFEQNMDKPCHVSVRRVFRCVAAQKISGLSILRGMDLPREDFTSDLEMGGGTYQFLLDWPIIFIRQLHVSGSLFGRGSKDFIN